MIAPSNSLFIRFSGLFARATKIALCPALLAVIAIGAISASDWPQWRGPFFNGSSDETGLPEKFSPTENVVWTAEMPGEGASTPIILGNRIFLTSTERTNKRKLHAFCLDGETGKILWDLPAGDSYQRIESNSSPSSPSPIADGQRIYFYFGSGQLMAVDLGGKELWRRDLDKDHGVGGIKYGYSSSPLLYQGKLYVPAIQNPKPWIEGRAGQQGSYLLCLDPATGKDIWKQKRPSDAVNESLEAYTTPVPCEVNGRAMILTAGGDYVVANDAKSGEELWRQIYVPLHVDRWRLIPSCVVADGLVIGTQPRNSPLYAFKAEGPAGKRGYDQLLWRQSFGSDSPTALYYQGRIYNVHSQRGKIACIDPKSGKVIWEGQLDSTGDFRGSPTGADGRIYLINIKGQAFTLSAGLEFKVLSRATMGGFPVSSTISVANKRLYIRTAEKLYCIGKGAGTSAPAPAAKP